MPMVAADVQSALAGHSVWWNKNVAWVKAPREVNRHLASRPATILYFRADGEFGIHYCRVIRGQGYVTISLGDGHVIHEGRWSLAGSSLAVHHRLVFEDIPIFPPHT